MLTAASTLFAAQLSLCPAATDYHVKLDGSGDYTAIQACAAVLQPGDTCIVHEGVYDERVVTQEHGTNNALITFRAEGAVTMQGFEVNHDYVRVDGFDITGHAVMYAGFIEIDHDASYCEIVNNTIRDGAGITLDDVLFHNNGPTNDTITSATGGFLGEGFKTGSLFRVTSDHSISNARTWEIKAVGENTIVLADSEELVDEGPVYAYFRIEVKGIEFESGGGTNAGDSADHCLVASNTISNIHNTAIDVLGAMHLVTHNELTDLHGYDAFRLFGAEHVISENFVHDSDLVPGNINHPDFVQTFGDNSREARDMRFEKNFVLNFDGQISMLTHNGVEGIRGWVFQSNVFVNVRAQMNVGIPGVHVLNNTYYDTTRNISHPLNCWTSYRASAEHVIVKNNVFADCGEEPDWYGEKGWYTIDEGLTNVVADHNFVCGPPESGYPAKAGFVGAETNGINGGNPFFFDEDDPLGADGRPFTQDDGLRPMPASPLHNAGEGGVNVGAYASMTYTGGNPVAYFTVTPNGGYAPLEVTLDGSHSIAPHTITNYAWDLGDSGTATGAVARNTYTAGQYRVVLTVTDTSGATGVTERSFDVYPVLEPGLLLYLPLSYTNADMSGRGHSVEWMGAPSYGPGRIGAGAALDGTTDGPYLLVQSERDLDGLAALTIAVWARKDGANAGGELVRKHSVYWLACDDSGMAGFLKNTSGVDCAVSATVANSDTNWHHYALTYDGTNVLLLFDGSPVKTGTLSGRVAVQPSRDVYVGKYQWDHSFSGTVDEVRLYDRALGTGTVMWVHGPHGTPQWWFDLHGLANGSIVDLELSDTDFDGMTAWQEWIAATIPTNGDSVLILESISTLSDTSLAVVAWQSVSNRAYDLDRATNLQENGFLPRAEDIQGVPPSNTYTDSVEGLSSPVYYRVRTGNQ